MANGFKVWDIWYIDYAFDDDPEQSKDRPALITSVNPLSFVVLKITGHEPRDEYDYEIKKWQEAGLEKKSCIRTKHRLSAQEADFRRKAGELHKIDRMCLGILLASY